MTAQELEPVNDETTVHLRRQWNNWMETECRLGDISDIHWDDFSGGVKARALRPFIHGYISCDKVVGEIAHSCAHGEGPHRIKVCVLQKNNGKVTIRPFTQPSGAKMSA